MNIRLLAILILLIGLISCKSKVINQESSNLLEKGLTEMMRVNLDSLDNDYSAAIAFFSESIELDTKNFEAQHWKMYCEMLMNKLDDAKMTFEKAFKNGLNDGDKLAPVFYVLGGVTDKMNKTNSTENFDKAFKIYSLRIKKDKNNIDAIVNKASIYCWLDQKSNAIAFVDSMIKIVDSPAILIDFKNGLADINYEDMLSKMIKTK